jgi:hypothetical protein
LRLGHFVFAEIKRLADGHPMLGLLVIPGVGLTVSGAHQKRSGRNERKLHPHAIGKSFLSRLSMLRNTEQRTNNQQAG